LPDSGHGEGEAEHRVLRGFRRAIELSVIILALELVGAYLSRSLSLTVDAVHNIPDIIAFALSYSALRATEGGTTDLYTFGAHRFEVFAGLLNAGLILATGAGFGYTALVTLLHGQTFAGPLDPVWIILVAMPTLGLRAVSLNTLGRFPGRKRDLNLNSVVVHLASDLVITAALLVAGFILLLHPSWSGADAAAALIIGAILVYESIPLFREGLEVLTERTPRNLSVEEISRVARSTPSVSDVHDVHVWAVCPTLICMSAHVRVREMSVRDGMDVAAALREKMAKEFGIHHAVFEVEVGPGPPPSSDG
jgi:cobalt-zinc-cadmium efflux system protein